MSIVYHERPGVYSDYTVSGVSLSAGRAKVVALIGYSEADAGLYVLNDPADAASFGESSELGKMVKLAYQNGAGTMLAYSVGANTLTDYQSAFRTVFQQRTASFCAIGSTLETVQTAFAEALEEAAEQRGECIGIVGLSAPSKAALLSRAQTLNHERVVLVGPDVYLPGQTQAAGGCMAAAALAGLLASQTDPALPLNGASLAGLDGVTGVFSETEIDALVQGGVTVLERQGGSVCVLRGVTTRQTGGTDGDSAYHELTVMTVLDDVIPAIREVLSSRFSRAKNSAMTRGAIRSQVVAELEGRVEREIIDSYGDVSVQSSQADASVCIVSFRFAVTHGLNRIFLTAHISV